MNSNSTTILSASPRGNMKTGRAEAREQGESEETVRREQGQKRAGAEREAKEERTGEWSPTNE